MTKSDFSRTFLDRIGYGTPIQQRARKGQLGDHLMLLELAALVAESDETAEEYVALENAVHRGELRATLKATPPPANEVMQRSGANMQREAKGTPRLEPPPLVHRYSVHRDYARRYFRSLRLEPEPRSPLWCWINNADENSPPSASSNTVEVDAKQRAIDLW